MDFVRFYLPRGRPEEHGRLPLAHSHPLLRVLSVLSVPQHTSTTHFPTAAVEVTGRGDSLESQSQPETYTSTLQQAVS